jgi:hypothetical protein
MIEYQDNPNNIENRVLAEVFVPTSVVTNAPNSCDNTSDMDKKYINATNVAPSNDGFLRRSDVSFLVSNFESQIIFSERNPIADVISNFGEEDFRNSVNATNLFFYRAKNPIAPQAKIDFLQYPNIEFRLNQGTSITSVEIAEFTISNFFTPQSLTQEYIENPSVTLRQWDNFYNSSFSKSSLGSFCALAPTIFGAVAGFFTLAQDLAGKISDFIGKITNFSIASLLDNLKNQISKIIDKSIENIKNIVENFNVGNIISKVQTFTVESILAIALQIKDEALSFFSEENIKAFKEKVNGLLAYAINIFKNPSLEEIQYLIYRFCTFIEQVEGLIDSVKAPLDSFASNFNSSYDSIRTTSAMNTTRAIQSGALRFDSQTRKSQTDSMQDRTRATGTSNPQPVSEQDIEGVTSWNGGKGDNRIKMGPGLQSNRMGIEGWIRVSPTARIYLMRVQKRFGKVLTVTSGYRSPAYNKSIDGAKNSKHMDGTAFDITWSGINTQNREEFINIAYEEGFLGIGRYGNRFVHIDLGPKRNWGS